MTNRQTAPVHISDLNAEIINLLRVHWPEVLPYFKALSGEEPSIHGSMWFDEAACVFEVQRIALSNGFTLTGNAQAAQVHRVLRPTFKAWRAAFKRNQCA